MASTQTKKHILFDYIMSNMAGYESRGILIEPSLIYALKEGVEKHLKGELDVFDIECWIQSKMVEAVVEQLKSYKLLIKVLASDSSSQFLVDKPHGIGGYWWWCKLETPTQDSSAPERICLSIDEILTARKLLKMENWGIRR